MLGGWPTNFFFLSSQTPFTYRCGGFPCLGVWEIMRSGVYKVLAFPVWRLKHVFHARLCFKHNHEQTIF